jgi:hypothetical protein
MKTNPESTPHGAAHGAKICPACRGHGITSAALLEMADGSTRVASAFCQSCYGSGEVDASTVERVERGTRFRRWRLDNEITLRAAAALLHVTATELTRAELGLEPNLWLAEELVLRQSRESSPPAGPSDAVENGWLDSRGRP